jgi:hypothetical protein
MEEIGNKEEIWLNEESYAIAHSSLSCPSILIYQWWGKMIS